MLATFSSLHVIYLLLAIIFEVAANVLMKLAHGFEHKRYIFLAIPCVLAAFTALSFAIGGLYLSVAYGIWGGLGLIATALIGNKLFDEQIQFSGWMGLGLILLGVVLIKLA